MKFLMGNINKSTGFSVFVAKKKPYLTYCIIDSFFWAHENWATTVGRGDVLVTWKEDNLHSGD